MARGAAWFSRLFNGVVATVLTALGLVGIGVVLIRVDPLWLVVLVVVIVGFALVHGAYGIWDSAETRATTAQAERDAIQAQLDSRSAVARQRVETFKRLIELRTTGFALSNEMARMTNPCEMFSDSDMAARVDAWSRDLAKAVSQAGWDLAATFEATVLTPRRLDPTETRMPLQQSLDMRLTALDQVLKDMPQKFADFHEVGTQ